MRTECENCGCTAYDGACTNCHEEVYIEDQYHALGMQLPDQDSDFMQTLTKKHQDIDRKQMIKSSY